MSSFPKLLWFSVPGLGSDDLVDKLRHCPNMAGLLEHGALGMMHMPGVALPELFPMVAASQRQSFELPWSPALELDMPDNVLARTVVERYPRAIAISADEAPSVSPRHRSLGSTQAGGALTWALSRLRDLYFELRAAHQPELAFIELPGAFDACSKDHWQTLELIDTVIGQVLATAAEDATVMITSPVGREWSRVRIGLELALLRADVEIHAFGGIGPAALVTCRSELASELCQRICAWSALNQPSFHRTRRRSLNAYPGCAMVEVNSMTALHVTGGADVVVKDDRFWTSSGVALIRDPAIRHGAFIQLQASQSLAILEQLRRPVGERRGGPLDPWLGQAIGVGYLKRLVEQRLQSSR